MSVSYYLYVLQELLFSAVDAVQLLSLLWTEIIRHWGEKHTQYNEEEEEDWPESPTALDRYGNTIFDPSNYPQHPNPKVVDEINPLRLIDMCTHRHTQTRDDFGS